MIIHGNIRQNLEYPYLPAKVLRKTKVIHWTDRWLRGVKRLSQVGREVLGYM